MTPFNRPPVTLNRPSEGPLLPPLAFCSLSTRIIRVEREQNRRIRPEHRSGKVSPGPAEWLEGVGGDPQKKRRRVLRIQPRMGPGLSRSMTISDSGRGVSGSWVGGGLGTGTMA